MTDPAPSQASGAAAAARCRRCSYNLAGLAAEALCPECSLPARESLGSFQLVNAEPAYRRRLRRGAMFISWAIPVLLVAVLASIILTEIDVMPRWLDVTLDVVVVLILAVAVLCHLLYTAAERSDEPGARPPRSRRVVHIAVLCLAVTIAFQLVMIAAWQRVLAGRYDWMYAWSIAAMVNWSLMIVGLGVLMTATAAYTGWLSSRLSDSRGVRLARRCRQFLPFLIAPFMLWSIVAAFISWRARPSPDVLVLIGGSGIAVSVAVLAAILLYWTLLLRIPGRIRRCADRDHSEP